MPRLRLECRSGAVHVIPGQSFEVQARLWNFGPIAVDIEATRLRVPADYQAHQIARTSLAPPDLGASPKRASRSAFRQAALSSPYWLVEPRGQYAYRWPPERYCSSPFRPLGSRPSAKFRWKDSAS